MRIQFKRGHYNKKFCSAGKFVRNWKTTQTNAFATILTDQQIIKALQEFGYKYRKSNFQPVAIVRSLLFRALSDNCSIQKTVTSMIAQGCLNKPVSKSAWDQARSRLPVELLPYLARRITEQTKEIFPALWRGHDIYLADGTTVSTPDEKDIANEFGYCDSKHGLSRFPVARMLAILHGGTCQVMDYRIAHYRTSELALFRELMPNLPPNSLWIADRYFSSSIDFVVSRRMNLHFLTRLHQVRKPDLLIKEGKKLGKDEWLVNLKISPGIQKKYADLDLPVDVNVRLVRVRYRTPSNEKRTSWLVTSLLDSKKYPRDELIDLYRSRWGIETHIGYLKTTMKMAILRSKTADNIRREVGAIILVHNLIWRLMHEAGEFHGIDVERLSFTGAMDTALAYSVSMQFSKDRKSYSLLYNEMLAHIASLQVPIRPGRHEPRMVKRDVQRFPVLRISREEARKCA